MQDIGESLAVLVGENYVNRFGMEGRSYDVIPQSLRDQRFTPQALARQFVRTQDGNPCRCRRWSGWRFRSNRTS